MKNDCYKLRELFWPILKFSYLPFRPHWKQHRCTCWNSTTYIRWNISRRYQRYICNCRIKGNPPKRDQIKKCHFLPSCVFRSHGLPSQSVSKLPGWCFSFYLLFLSTSSWSQIIWSIMIRRPHLRSVLSDPAHRTTIISTTTAATKTNNDYLPQFRPLRPSAQQVEVFQRQCKVAQPRIWTCTSFLMEFANLLKVCFLPWRLQGQGENR